MGQTPGIILYPKADDATILALHEAGKGSRKIQEVVGLSYRSICRRLKELTPRKTTEIYRELKADILAEKQRKLLQMSHGADPKEQQQIATAFGIYFDKERLTRGESTSNVAQIDLSDRLREALKRSSIAKQGIEQSKQVIDIQGNDSKS